MEGTPRAADQSGGSHVAGIRAKAIIRAGDSAPTAMGGKEQSDACPGGGERGDKSEGEPSQSGRGKSAHYRTTAAGWRGLAIARESDRAGCGLVAGWYWVGREGKRGLLWKILASVGCRLCVGFVISTAVILNGGYIYKIGCTIS